MSSPSSEAQLNKRLGINTRHFLPTSVRGSCILGHFTQTQISVLPVNDGFSAALFPRLQGHVYSLGSTLSAALNFVIEPELETELGEEVQRLLEQMQEETPEDRPDLQVQTPPRVTWVAVQAATMGVFVV